MILIIEDEKNISNLLKLELTHANYECDQAFDGESGLNKAFILASSSSIANGLAK